MEKWTICPHQKNEVIVLAWAATNHDPYVAKIDNQLTNVYLEDDQAFYFRTDKPVSLSENPEPGPNLALYESPEYRNRITRHYIFSNDAERSRKAAKLVTGAINKIHGGVHAEAIQTKVTKPTHHFDIFSNLCEEVAKIQDQFPEAEGNEYIVQVSPGTPAMHAVWLLMVKSEILKATLVETTPPTFLKDGEAPVRQIDLDIPELPTVKKYVRRLLLAELRGKPNRMRDLALLFASEKFGGEKHCGFDCITHSQRSMDDVAKCLERVEDDLELARNSLTKDGFDELSQYIQEAKSAFNDGPKAYQSWSAENTGRLHGNFRFRFLKWINQARSTYGDMISVTLKPGNMTRDPAIYCERQVIEAGLYAIINSALQHAWPEGSCTDKEKLKKTIRIHFTKSPGKRVLRILNTGVGFPGIREAFTALSSPDTGTAGTDLRRIARLADYFHVQVNSVCRQQYTLNSGDLAEVWNEHTGTEYIITVELPPEKDS